KPHTRSRTLFVPCLPCNAALTVGSGALACTVNGIETAMPIKTANEKQTRKDFIGFSPVNAVVGAKCLSPGHPRNRLCRASGCAPLEGGGAAGDAGGAPNPPGLWVCPPFRGVAPKATRGVPSMCTEQHQCC